MNISNESLNAIIKSNPEILNQWVILISECHQKSEGPKGQEYHSKIIFKEVNLSQNKAKGFDKKGDWRKVIDPSWARKVLKKKVNGDITSYDEIGSIYRTIQNTKLGDVLKQNKNGEYQFLYLNEYFHSSEHEAIDGRKHLKK